MVKSDSYVAGRCGSSHFFPWEALGAGGANSHKTHLRQLSHYTDNTDEPGGEMEDDRGSLEDDAIFSSNAFGCLRIFHVCMRVAF